MTYAQGHKRRLVLVLALIAAVVLIVGGVIALNISSPEPRATVTPSPQSTEVDDDDTSTDSSVESQPAQSEASSVPTVDPATLNSVEITPLAIEVFYTKGIDGFDFTVKRTADQTEYVEFSTAALAGTKCTDDQGSIASIIKNPTPATLLTTTQTVKVGDVTYGLSLAGSDCTPDAALLDQYQTAFKNGFSSLRAL